MSYRSTAVIGQRGLLDLIRRASFVYIKQAVRKPAISIHARSSSGLPASSESRKAQVLVTPDNIDSHSDECKQKVSLTTLSKDRLNRKHFFKMFHCNPDFCTAPAMHFRAQHRWLLVNEECRAFHRGDTAQ